MKIVHLNTFDLDGGAARAASRLHAGLRALGVDSAMVVAHQKAPSPHVSRYPITRLHMKLSLAGRLLGLQRSTNPAYHSCNLFASGIADHLNRSDADVIHLHWIGYETISIAEVARIRKPIVWTLHDMWAFCGAEHYDDIDRPGRYREGYRLSNRPPGRGLRPDIDAWTWRRKRRHWRDMDFHFVTPSAWLARCLGESALFGGRSAAVIPNCLDTGVFRPVDREAACRAFELSPEKRYVLFGSDFIGQNPLKGHHLLVEALPLLAQAEKPEPFPECIVFGGQTTGRTTFGGMVVHEVGRIEDDAKLAGLYSLADVFVCPSMIDNLPNTVMEALSCGTPCVAFAVGGLADMVVHRENGYLAPPYGTRELAAGIEYVLAERRAGSRLETTARNLVMERFTPQMIAARYKALYAEVLEGNGGRRSVTALGRRP